MYTKEQITAFVQNDPILQDIIAKKPVTWLNPDKKTMASMPNMPIKKKDIYEAAELWDRFAPFLAKVFPETKKSNGKIESPLQEVSKMKNLLNKNSLNIDGQLLLKCDNALPIAGSIKARGGFFEV